MNQRRIARLQEQIKVRAAQVVNHELSDPRRGLITITKVKLDREMETCKIYWSVLGTDKDRVKNQHMLDRAARYVQREIAQALSTRTTPRISFEFDESIEGAIRIDGILRELEEERSSRQEPLDVDEAADGPPP